MILGQHEAKMKSMAESMQEVEVKKRQLEEHVSITWQNQDEVRIEHDRFLSPSLALVQHEYYLTL